MEIWDIIQLLAPKSFELLSRLKGQRLNNSDQVLLFMAIVNENTLKTAEAIERLADAEALNSKKLDLILSKVSRQ